MMTVRLVSDAIYMHVSGMDSQNVRRLHSGQSTCRILAEVDGQVPCPQAKQKPEGPQLYSLSMSTRDTGGVLSAL